jgi:hypothetical protein
VIAKGSLAKACIGKSHEKRIRITVYKEYYDRALPRALSKKGKYFKTLRQSTLEPVFGTLINFMGMRKINTRSINNANKVMVMAAIEYNLKKLLKYQDNNKLSEIVTTINNTCEAFYTCTLTLLQFVITRYLRLESEIHLRSEYILSQKN